MDKLNIGGHTLDNRLLIGTGKYPNHRIMYDAIQKSGSKVITMALRRVDINSKKKIF